ncbi:hypothetical protein LK07_20105 [Streptomyces pluripotens]|uniref:L,D-transpeptidase n=1 Tax=Streptomyces pluripotens TaxID=1355015 RepID=A0A221P0Y8_9ACTN|nr:MULTISPECIES: hypothetical protein [Streptomyces]ARP71681.1 hypothetical protein LK06_018945 [Streptomyces pluripotens]ASN25933.1 hypothetical protein LK07_20105 [Streptomyces pluripotens]KIE27578.1 hypothetical protein LK08_08110 [Streptomyces sp. MUSC 125]MCH0557618.1 hypothetical protein [Streptomyces sp. MUM 16J]
MAARLPTWAWVTGLTAGATAVVVALAIQADHGPRPTAATAKPKTSASPRVHASAAPAPSAPPALPDGSGTGRRIVYSVGEKRVWMVDATGKATRTFAVWPGTVSPLPGRYSITLRTQSLKGSDGVEIEHVMYFTKTSGVNIAFSNALDGSSPPPANGQKLGGVRLHKEDGAALWAFGDRGTRVAVVK